MNVEKHLNRSGSLRTVNITMYPLDALHGLGGCLARWRPWCGALLLLSASLQVIRPFGKDDGTSGGGASSPDRGVAALAAAQSTQDLVQARVFDEPLIPLGEPAAGENGALASALRAFALRTVRDDFSSLTEFLGAHPASAWSMTLEASLGQEFYHVGLYSKAIESWQRAWQLGKSATEELPRSTAHRAASELARMYARLGRMAELRALLRELDGRPFHGASQRNLASAREGLWTMENRPEVAFRCGPLALDSICRATEPAKAGNQLIQDAASTTNGFSAWQVAELSRRMGMDYQVAFREAGAPIILPAVAHWKVGHFAALLRRSRDGLIQAQDPTFGNQTWFSDAALDHESSGYFLVRSGPLPEGWRAVPEGEAGRVWGKGTTNESDPDATTEYDEKAKEDCESWGMAAWNVHLLLTNQTIEDTPAGYRPPVGPPVDFSATYNAKEVNQAATAYNYSNLGFNWSFNWLAFLRDEPLNPAADVTYFVEGGGGLTFVDFDPVTKSFRNEFRNVARLYRTSASSYEMRFPDGSRKIFAQPDGSAGTKRRVFLTAVVDPQGNSVTLHYDALLRIRTITDAIGQQTTLHYELPPQGGSPEVAQLYQFRITRVVDPFGRSAVFQFAPGPFGFLTNIIDSIGLSSHFVYGVDEVGDTDHVTHISEMTTPYGVTRFKTGSVKTALYRANWIEITHPSGEKERVEYSERSPVGVLRSDPLAVVPKGMPVRNLLLWARNTYYWDRKAYAESFLELDYTKARIYHFTHGLDYNTASPILESYKPPLEARVWFNYEGQVNPTFVGTSARPTTIGRVLDNGATQLHRFAYNSAGNVTRTIDPIGREFSFAYDTNEVDLLEVRQTRAGHNDLLLSVRYNARHLPTEVIDTAGQRTAYTYNSRGQVLAITNPRGDTTAFEYDSQGYLTASDGPLPGTIDISRYTYDHVGRLRKATDTDGYTLTFEYDALDRLTRITYPDGSYETIAYNRLDVAMVRDRAGRETRFTHDSLRRLASVEDPLGRVTRYDWCGCGGLDALIDPLGRLTAWRRDIQGRVTSKVYPDGSEVLYEYEPASGRLKQIRDEQGQIIAFQWNLDDTLAEKSYRDTKIPTAPIRFTYDSNFLRAAAMEDGTGRTQFSYHPIGSTPMPGAGLLAARDGPLDNDTITFAYDELGRVSERAVGGVTERRAWDAMGRVTNQVNALGLFAYSWEGATYRLSSAVYPNGQRSSFKHLGNDKDRMLSEIAHLKPDSSLLARFSYTYNQRRQISTWVQDQAGAPPLSYQFDYDAVGQLTNAVTTAGSIEYTYDLAGNRTSEVTPAGARTFHHNILNQLTQIRGTTPAEKTYERDGEGRLAALQDGHRRTEFLHDAFGRTIRIVEKVDGVEQSVRRFLWCGMELFEERSEAGTTLRRFFGPGFQSVTSGQELPPGSYFQVLDHLGSVRAVTASDGSPIAEFTYSLFGEQTRIGGSFSSDFGFTGHLVHPPSGLCLAPARPYDPALGRWLSRDPLGESAGLNLYLYVNNDPLNTTDPLGLVATWNATYHPNWAAIRPNPAQARMTLVPKSAAASSNFAPRPSLSGGLAALLITVAPALLQRLGQALDAAFDKSDTSARMCTSDSHTGYSVWDSEKGDWVADYETDAAEMRAINLYIADNMGRFGQMTAESRAVRARKEMGLGPMKQFPFEFPYEVMKCKSPGKPKKPDVCR